MLRLPCRNSTRRRRADGNMDATIRMVRTRALGPNYVVEGPYGALLASGPVRSSTRLAPEARAEVGAHTAATPAIVTSAACASGHSRQRCAGQRRRRPSVGPPPPAIPTPGRLEQKSGIGGREATLPKPAERGCWCWCSIRRALGRTAPVQSGGAGATGFAAPLAAVSRRRGSRRVERRSTSVPL